MLLYTKFEIFTIYQKICGIPSTYVYEPCNTMYFLYVLWQVSGRSY